jgi:hypothetical protein
MCCLALALIACGSATRIAPRVRISTIRACEPASSPYIPVVTVKEAEAGFVDDENLELGEALVRALKAFDSDGRLLCAGALLKRHSASAAQDVHDVWLADSFEAGVGPNLQLRGAQAVLDEVSRMHRDEPMHATHSAAARAPLRELLLKARAMLVFARR